MEPWERDEQARSHGHGPSAGLMAPQPSLLSPLGEHRAEQSTGAGAGGEMSGPLSVLRPVLALLGSSAVSQGGGGGSRATGEPQGTFWRELVLTLRAAGNLRKRTAVPFPSAHLSLLSISPWATLFLSLGRISLFSFSINLHSVCLSSFLSCQAVFSLSFTVRLLLCLFLLLSFIPQNNLFLPIFTLSPFSSPFLPHLLTGCLLFLSVHFLWSWVSCCPLSPPQQ